MDRAAGARPMRENARGGALAAAILLSLAALLLAHGALLLARQEALAAGASRGVLAARAAAEWGALRAAEQLLPEAPDDAPMLATFDSVTGVLEDARYRGVLRRIGRDLWLAEGEGAAGVARTRVALPLRRTAPESLFGALGAVASVGVAPEAADVAWVDETAFEAVTLPAPPEGCEPAPPSPDGPPVSQWRVDPGLFPGDPRDPLDPEKLAGQIGMAVAGVGRPQAAESAGACVETAWNWGDVTRPGGACADRMPAVVAADGTVATDGAGQALLVGRGDLTLSGVALYGGVVVAGRLRLERGSVVTGFVKAAGGIEFGGGAVVRGSRCWAMRALSVDPLSAPALVPGGGWVLVHR